MSAFATIGECPLAAVGMLYDAAGRRAPQIWDAFLLQRVHRRTSPFFLEFVAKFILLRSDLGEHEGRYSLVLLLTLDRGMPDLGPIA